LKDAAIVGIAQSRRHLGFGEGVAAEVIAAASTTRVSPAEVDGFASANHGDERRGRDRPNVGAGDVTFSQVDGGGVDLPVSDNCDGDRHGTASRRRLARARGLVVGPGGCGGSPRAT
jgi:hypothetical protein